jgi:dipeptidyl aminopeptidase/acylaminoacyl peptidase
MRPTFPPVLALLAVAAALLAPAAPGAESRPDVTPGLDPEDVYELRTIGSLEISSDGSLLAYTVDAAEEEANSYRSTLRVMELDGKNERLLTRKGADDRRPRFSPDGKRLAFLSDRGDDPQIYTAPAGRARARRITNVAGGVDAYEWSPDGRFFVFVRSDPPAAEEEAARARTPRDADSNPELAPYVITRSQIQTDGEGFLGSSRSHLWVVPSEGGTPRRITSGPYDDTQPQWSPDGKWIVFVSNRAKDPDATDDTDLYLVRPDGTEERRLAGNPGPDEYPRWSRSGRSIAFVGKLRENDYYQTSHVMVVPATGGTPTSLTASLDTWVASDALLAGSEASRITWSPDDTTLFVTLERRGANWLAAIPAGGGEPREILSGPRVHDLVRFAPDGRIFYAPSDPTHPPEIEVAGPDGKGARPLTRLHAGLLARVRLSTPEKILARNADGDEVESWLYPPVGLDPAKKYPMILYIHGGPQGFDGDYFDTDLENQVFAARGFAVLRVNYRGSTSYGEKFCRALWADWHRREYDDLMVSVDEALKRPWIDGERLGLGGWSYGGIMTIWTVAHTNRFRVGVPERFEIDYLSCFGEDQYFVQYLTELGSPFENADLYRKLSPGTYVPRIKTPLYLIANENDRNCPPSQAFQLYQRLKLLGIKTELVIYPEETHTLAYPSHIVDRLHRLIGWFSPHLR